MAGNSAIFRLTTAGQTESTVGSTEKVEFNGGLVPDARGFINQSEIEMGASIPEQPTPGANLTELQDAGLFDTIITIRGFFTDRSLAGQGPLNLKNWMEAAKDNSNFPHGRFGLRLNDWAAFDLTPSATLGYYISYVKFITEGEFFNPVGFIAVLKKSKGA